MITREMLSSGLRSFNLELSTWSNMPVNLWKVEKITIPLTQGVATYTLDSSVQLVMDAYTNLVQSGQDDTDRLITAISRTEFASYVDKQTQGLCTVFWLDRLSTPTITLWPVPDGVTTTNLVIYAMKRVQDVSITNGQTPDIPYRFIEALCARLAARLAVKYAKAMLPVLQPLADMAYQQAIEEDHERAELSITPIMGGYFQ